MPVVTKVQICNLALSLVGEQGIQDIEGNGKNEQICKLLYEEVLEEVLQAHPWNFAKFRKELAEDTSDPVFGWENSFPLPTDPRCLQVLYTEENELWNIEGRKLVTNASTANIAYIGYIENPNDIPPLVRRVFYHEMAALMAYRQTERNTVKAGIEEALKIAWSQARVRDAQEGTPQYQDNSNWITARYARIGYGRDITTRR